MAKVGRKPFQITDDVLAKVEDYASKGLTQEQIAAVLGISEATFYKYKSENTEFSEAIKKGMAQGVELMASQLIEHAKNGSTSAAIFYLKCHGWKEANALEVTDNRTATGMKDFYSELNENLKKVAK